MYVSGSAIALKTTEYSVTMTGSTVVSMVTAPAMHVSSRMMWNWGRLHRLDPLAPVPAEVLTDAVADGQPGLTRGSERA